LPSKFYKSDSINASTGKRANGMKKKMKKLELSEYETYD
jgi:hypothetical protein